MSRSLSGQTTYARGDSARYQDVSWVGESHQGEVFTGAYFEDSDLRFADFQGANLWGATLIRCDLRGACFAYAQLGGARLIGCRLSEDTLDYASLESTVISDLEPYLGLESHLNDHIVRYIKANDYMYAVYCWRSVQDTTRDQDAIHDTNTTRDADNARSRVDLRPLVMLHGHTGHALDFLPLAIRCSPRPVYAIQLLGHGETSALPLSLEHELDDELIIERVSPSYLEVVRDIVQVLNVLLVGEPKFDLLGYSMGGRLALHVASHLASISTTATSESSSTLRLRRVITIGASLGIQAEEERAERRARDRLWSDPLWESDSASPFLGAWRRQPLIARLHERSPLVARRLNDHRRHHDPRGLAIAFDALGQGAMPPLHDLLSGSSTPVYWVHGGDDPKYRDIATRAVALHATSERVEIPNTGHSPHLEDFESFWRLVGPLLSG